MNPRIGSLFSGAGMLDEGVRAVLGGTVAWHAEVDPGARKVLDYRYPGVPNLGDVTAIDWATVEPVDVITGGSPCQDVSHAGKRAGMRAGTRSGLWASMVDAIDILRPSLVVWENVRGVLSAEADSAMEPGQGLLGDGAGQPALRALGRVLGDLASIGYDARWCGLRAADVGAPHGRFRVFVAARPADAAHVGHQRCGDARAGRPGSTHDGLAAPHATGNRWSGRSEETAERRANAGGSWSAATGLSANLAAYAHDHATWYGREPRHTGGRAGESAQRGGRATADAYGDALRVEPVSEFGSGSAPVAGHAGPVLQADAFADSTSGRLEGRSEPHGHNGSASGRRPMQLAGVCDDGVQWGQYEPAIRRWEHVTGRPAPAPTEPGPRGGQRLSPRLTEFMMGWPDGWVTDVPGITRNEALKICGNGVVPQQAAEALCRMLAAEAVAA